MKRTIGYILHLVPSVYISGEQYLKEIDDNYWIWTFDITRCKIFSNLEEITEVRNEHYKRFGSETKIVSVYIEI
jgi:hypothetical protein